MDSSRIFLLNLRVFAPKNNPRPYITDVNELLKDLHNTLENHSPDLEYRTTRDKLLTLEKVPVELVDVVSTRLGGKRGSIQNDSHHC